MQIAVRDAAGVVEGQRHVVQPALAADIVDERLFVVERSVAACVGPVNVSPKINGAASCC